MATNGAIKKKLEPALALGSEFPGPNTPSGGRRRLEGTTTDIEMAYDTDVTNPRRRGRPKGSGTTVVQPEGSQKAGETIRIRQMEPVRIRGRIRGEQGEQQTKEMRPPGERRESLQLRASYEQKTHEWNDEFSRAKADWALHVNEVSERLMSLLAIEEGNRESILVLNTRVDTMLGRLEAKLDAVLAATGNRAPRVEQEPPRSMCSPEFNRTMHESIYGLQSNRATRLNTNPRGERRRRSNRPEQESEDADTEGTPKTSRRDIEPAGRIRTGPHRRLAWEEQEIRGPVGRDNQTRGRTEEPQPPRYGNFEGARTGESNQFRATDEEYQPRAMVRDEGRINENLYSQRQVGESSNRGRANHYLSRLVKDWNLQFPGEFEARVFFQSLERSVFSEQLSFSEVKAALVWVLQGKARIWYETRQQLWTCWRDFKEDF